ncbi:erythronate-4-phosphate dehydrogenase [Rhodothermaceae bacterium RA]|nr:erythronate-4-phosphate dehydrogenase [Rhodothermaceae bacterium RA]
MQILADENIPFVQEAFGTLGTVRTRPGRQITRADLASTDVLLVRSVTPVNAALLEGTPVRFVGSATIGTDHVDLDYLAQRGIAFAHAPGSNAESVVEYVLAALYVLARRHDRPLRGQTVGIVGCGNIGGRLAQRLPALGAAVLCCDPPRAEQAEREGRPHAYRPLAEVLAAADVVTVHVPFTRTGPHPTYHLLNAETLRQMPAQAWLLNTSRGAVVDNPALRAAREAGHLGGVVLDVWEGEPEPDVALLRRVDLATPHIAGYSYDGKVAGTRMLYDAVTAHFGLEASWTAEAELAAGPEDRLALTPPATDRPEAEWMHALIRQMYDIEADDARMRRLAELPAVERAATFTALRKHYPRRRTFALHTLPGAAVPPAYRTAVAEGLRVRLV